MSKIKLTKVPFSGTAKQEKELRDKLATIKKMDGALMPALQAAQDIYGYLPAEVQQIISEELDISLEEIFGVATFYSQFSLNPKGNIEISICMGTACYVKGSGEVLDKFKEILKIDAGDCTADGKYGLVATRCIGCCGLAPVLTVNDKVYGKVTVSDVEKIIEENS
ncbi:MAG: NAD(P)H-dependent oxidoreductase subunit E [Bacillota bacterium]|jgi:NADP-reducing hydrogenase subunit HndA|nr:NAD(P)H-dependent oxidoreductase subunit E [Bacillota bacterium]HHU43304.1 NAD(P)H-dependent oxidoreductase subunit E [Clostridiales bacterium]